MYTQKRTLEQWLALLGIVGAVFYFLHVIIGKANYPGYSSMAQAISDLTAATAPSREIASALTGIYGLFTVAACTILCIFYQRRTNKPFRAGIYLFAVMQWISGVGYTLFPLSDSGYAGTFQDVMHVVVTAFVVLPAIASMVLITIGTIKTNAHRWLGILTMAALAAMAIGSIGMGAFPAESFGIAERLNVYSVVLYTAVLSVFTFQYAEEI